MGEVDDDPTSCRVVVGEASEEVDQRGRGTQVEDAMEDDEMPRRIA